MHPDDLNEKLQSINPLLGIRRYWRKDGANDGVYYGNEYICAVPAGYVYLQKVPEYHNMFGIPHRSIENLVDILVNRHYIEWWDRWKLFS